MTKEKKALHKIQDTIFKGIHRNNLVYNTCWEDPRCDRELLQLDPESKVVMITSAGCNALDYLLDDPASIACVDVNPRQNALLNLKLVLLEKTDYPLLFDFFGKGRAAEAEEIYYTRLRHHLPGYAKKFWDKKINYFQRPAPRKSFYYRGTSGSVAWLFRKYINLNLRTKKIVEDMLVAPGLDHQAYLYYQVKQKLMTYAVRWIIGRQLTMSMVGVPRSQRDLIIQSKEGLYGFVESCLDHVFTQLPIADNYFWTVYLNGYYTVSCCPNYLLPDNFNILRERSNRITLYTTTISQFLQDNPGEYSHFVLLDHQDWLAEHNVKALREEWELILKNSRKGTRILLRSAANKIDFFPDFVMDAVEWETELTKTTHFYDRVGTYGSVYLGVVK